MLVQQTTFKPFCPKLENYGRSVHQAFVDAKIDGEYGVWFRNGIYNKNGKERRDFNASEFCKLLAAHLLEMTQVPFETLQIQGELHYNGGIAGDLYKLLSHKEDDNLNFTVFDWSATGSLLNHNFLDRREILLRAYRKAFEGRNKFETDKLRIVPFDFCESKGEIHDSFNKFVSEGYEGVVVRPTLWNTGFKWKSRDTADLKVLSADKWKERIGLENPNNPGTELCGCKINKSYDVRVAMVGLIVEIEYLQKLHNDKGVLTGLRNPSFVRMRDDKKEASL